MMCPIKVNSNTIELTVQASCYYVLDLLCVTSMHLDSKATKNPDFCRPVFGWIPIVLKCYVLKRLTS